MLCTTDVCWMQNNLEDFRKSIKLWILSNGTGRRFISPHLSMSQNEAGILRVIRPYVTKNELFTFATFLRHNKHLGNSLLFTLHMLDVLNHHHHHLQTAVYHKYYPILDSLFSTVLNFRADFLNSWYIQHVIGFPKCFLLFQIAVCVGIWLSFSCDQCSLCIFYYWAMLLHHHDYLYVHICMYTK